MSKKQEYIDSVEGNAHQSAVTIIGELEAENDHLGDLVDAVRQELYDYKKVFKNDDKLKLESKVYELRANELQSQLDKYKAAMKEILMLNNTEDALDIIMGIARMEKL